MNYVNVHFIESIKQSSIKELVFLTTKENKKKIHILCFLGSKMLFIRNSLTLFYVCKMSRNLNFSFYFNGNGSSALWHSLKLNFAFMWGDREKYRREKGSELKLDWVFVEFLMTAEGIV